jgi:hypothetical protein
VATANPPSTTNFLSLSASVRRVYLRRVRVMKMPHHVSSFKHTHTGPALLIPSLLFAYKSGTGICHPQSTQSSSCLWFIDSLSACASHLTFLAAHIPANTQRYMSVKWVLSGLGTPGESPKEGNVRYSGRFNPDQTRRCRTERSYLDNTRVCASLPPLLRGLECARIGRGIRTA